MTLGDVTTEMNKILKVKIIDLYEISENAGGKRGLTYGVTFLPSIS